MLAVNYIGNDNNPGKKNGNGGKKMTETEREMTATERIMLERKIEVGGIQTPPIENWISKKSF